MDGAEVVPPEYGYFLSRTWRMHPRVAEAVSRLSYQGKLASHPSTALRELDGIEAGVHAVPLRHSGNATYSPEEAAEVVRRVRDLVGREWTAAEVDDDGTMRMLPPRPLLPEDIIRS